jgi:hypothetical protein
MFPLFFFFNVRPLSAKRERSYREREQLAENLARIFSFFPFYLNRVGLPGID